MHLENIDLADFLLTDGFSDFHPHRTAISPHQVYCDCSILLYAARDNTGTTGCWIIQWQDLCPWSNYLPSAMDVFLNAQSAAGQLRSLYSLEQLFSFFFMVRAIISFKVVDLTLNTWHLVAFDNLNWNDLDVPMFICRTIVTILIYLQNILFAHSSMTSRFFIKRLHLLS